MRRALPAAALVAVLAGALPATADARRAPSQGNKCVVWADRYDLRERTRFGVVFSKGSSDDFDLYYYGCIYSTQRAFRLPDQDGGDANHLGNFQLDGRFAAYSWVNAEEAADANFGQVYVVDVKTGATRIRASAWPEETRFSTAADSIVVKANGSVAWIAELLGSPNVRDFSVQKIGVDEPGAPRTELDRGRGIAGDSLAKARDETTIYWLHDGQPRRATLR